MRLSNDHRRASVVAALLVVFVPPSTSGALESGAHVTRSMKVREHVALTLVKRTGASKFEHRGRATGTVAGSVRSVITLSHSVVLHGTVTIVTRRGKLRLKVDGRARSLSLRTKFDGSATISGGTGSYTHARGVGTFQGVVNRSTWAATIDASGSFTY